MIAQNFATPLIGVDIELTNSFVHIDLYVAVLFCENTPEEQLKMLKSEYEDFIKAAQHATLINFKNFTSKTRKQHL